MKKPCGIYTFRKDMFMLFPGLIPPGSTFFLYFFGVQLIYKVVLVSVVWHSDSVIHIYSFF